MTINATGVVAASSVNAELLASSSAPLEMSSALVRYLANKPTPGSPISLSELRGATFAATVSDISVPSGSNGISTTGGSSVAVTPNGQIACFVCKSTKVFETPSNGQYSGGGAVLIYELSAAGVYQLINTFVFKSDSYWSGPSQISISDDGTRIVAVGATSAGYTHPDTGPYLYVKTGFVTYYKSAGVWVQGSINLMDDVYQAGTLGVSPAIAQYTCISGDGSTACVSGMERSSTDIRVDVGAVYVYTWAGSGNWTRVQKIKPSGTTQAPYSGVQLSSNGAVMLVSNSSKAWIYRKSSSYVFEREYTPSLGGVTQKDASLSTATSINTFSSAHNYVLSPTGNKLSAACLVRVAPSTHGCVMMCSFTSTSLTQDKLTSAFVNTDSTFPLFQSMSLSVSPDGRRLCMASRSYNSSYVTNGTALQFWFMHPTTDAWVYQGSYARSYASPGSSEPLYSHTALRAGGKLGAAAMYSNNVVGQINS